MRTYRNYLLLAVACAGLTTAHAQTQTQQFPGRRMQSPLNVLHKALPETEGFTLTRFVGKPLRGANNEQLGTITDFLMDLQTGRIRYALAPSGVSSGGDTSYRLVPVTAFDRASGNDVIVVRINRDQWNRLGTISDAEMPGRLSLSAEQEQRAAQGFGVYAPNRTASNDLSRASKWKGQTVHSGGYQLGSVEDIVFDIPTRSSAALVRTTGGYPSNLKFVVPFERLELTGDGNAPISTNLTNADFQAAQGAFQPTGATSTQYGQTPAGQYGQTPANQYGQAAGQYGQTSGAQYGQAPAEYSAAANTVQQALARQSSLLYGASVQAVTESRLVLRGTAQNEAQRQAIENTARQSAPNLMIENQITIQGR